MSLLAKFQPTLGRWSTQAPTDNDLQSLLDELLTATEGGDEAALAELHQEIDTALAALAQGEPGKTKLNNNPNERRDKNGRWTDGGSSGGGGSGKKPLLDMPESSDAEKDAKREAIEAEVESWDESSSNGSHEDDLDAFDPDDAGTWLVGSEAAANMQDEIESMEAGDGKEEAQAMFDLMKERAVAHHAKARERFDKMHEALARVSGKDSDTPAIARSSKSEAEWQADVEKVNVSRAANNLPALSAKEWELRHTANPAAVEAWAADYDASIAAGKGPISMSDWAKAKGLLRSKGGRARFSSSWDEAKHDRANDGKFGSGGGSTTNSKGEEIKFTGKPMPPPTKDHKLEGTCVSESQIADAVGGLDEFEQLIGIYGDEFEHKGTTVTFNPKTREHFFWRKPTD